MRQAARHIRVASTPRRSMVARRLPETTQFLGVVQNGRNQGNTRAEEGEGFPLLKNGGRAHTEGGERGDYGGPKDRALRNRRGRLNRRSRTLAAHWVCSCTHT